VHQPKLVTWATFAFSIGLLGLVVWARLFATPARGEWKNQFAGARLDSLPVVDAQGQEIRIAHPALIYFYSSDCKFCPPAAQQINSFVTANGTAGLPVYALTNFGRIPQKSAEMFAPSVQVIKLTRTTPRLNFVKQVPLLIRTDAGGRIQRAYLGIAADSILAAMVMPREAGPVVR
jgi:thiol-disulfide isomerase/thioredoxin